MKYSHLKVFNRSQLKSLSLIRIKREQRQLSNDGMMDKPSLQFNHSFVLTFEFSFQWGNEWIIQNDKWISSWNENGQFSSNDRLYTRNETFYSKRVLLRWIFSYSQKQRFFFSSFIILMDFKKNTVELRRIKNIMILLRWGTAAVQLSFLAVDLMKTIIFFSPLLASASSSLEFIDALKLMLHEVLAGLNLFNIKKKNYKEMKKTMTGSTSITSFKSHSLFTSPSNGRYLLQMRAWLVILLTARHDSLIFLGLDFTFYSVVLFFFWFFLRLHHAIASQSKQMMILMHSNTENTIIIMIYIYLLTINEVTLVFLLFFMVLSAQWLLWIIVWFEFV